MAYVPPHKRQSKHKDGPLPSPELPPPHLNKNPCFKSSNSHAERSGKIIYAKQAISKWFVIGLDHNNQPPSYVHLQPISLEHVERKTGEKPLILVVDPQPPPEDVRDSCQKAPWEIITENVLEGLVSSFENVRNETEVRNLEEEVKPMLVARFGKILFHGGASLTQETVRRRLAAGTLLGQLKSSFYTNIPASYIEKVTREESAKIGLHFEEEKELYHVKLSDANRPNTTISCKCSVMKQLKKLKVYKIELNQLRHMVTDISCLAKNLDLRVMLCTKRILVALKDDERHCIQELIESAVLDSNVKGGLRWPLVKASSGDRFSVVGVWHTTTRAYSSESVRLKVRHADRFDFWTSTGESASEGYLKLKGVVSELLGQKEKVDIGLISKMLEDNLKLIWDHFLNCEHFSGCPATCFKLELPRPPFAFAPLGL